MSGNRQRAVLLILVAALAVLVVLDRVGLFGAGGSDALDEDAPITPRSLYLARAELANSQRALLEQADEWRAAAAAAEQAWTQARAGMIVERTVELAEARFRDEALQALQNLQLKSPRANPSRDRGGSAADASASGVRTLSMEVRFDAANQRDVYAAIARLESLRGIRTRIASLRIDGPGRMQAPPVITVTLTLHAQAAVGEAA